MIDRYNLLDQTLRSHFSVLYERQRLRFAADSTRKQFIINLAHFDRFLGRPATLDDLNDDTVSDLLAWFLRRPIGNAPRTANKCRDNILALWRFLARKQIVSRWPDVDAVPEPERVPVCWTKDELRRLFSICDEQDGQFCGVRQSLWWHSLHAVGWDTGERIGALMDTRWQWIDLQDRWLCMKAEARKGKRADKLWRLHPDTVEVLKLIQVPRRDLVFPWPYSHTYLWTKYGELLRRADLPHDRAHKFHCLRKSAASYFEAAGGNATQLLGHSGRRVTDKYIDPRICTPPQASDVLFRPNA
jgi:integrase